MANNKVPVGLPPRPSPFWMTANTITHFHPDVAGRDQRPSLQNTGRPSLLSSFRDSKPDERHSQSQHYHHHAQSRYMFGQPVAACMADHQQFHQQQQQQVSQAKKPRMMMSSPQLQLMSQVNSAAALETAAITSSSVGAKKEVYVPQVEAISPTPEDANVQQRNDELLQKIRKIDHECSVCEHNLKDIRLKRETLEKAKKPTEERVGVIDGNEESAGDGRSLAERIYAENRKKAAEAHAFLDRLYPTQPGPNSTPLYSQPSDTELVKGAISRHQEFRPRLILHLRKRNHARQIRERYLSERYDQLMNGWIKRIDRYEGNAKRREKESKRRDFYEKMFPEIRKTREDKEKIQRISNRPVGPYARSDAELQQIADTLQQNTADEQRQKMLAVVPPMMLDALQRKIKFENNNGLILDAMEDYKNRQNTNIWNERERQIFVERFCQTPKMFSNIQSCLPRHTVQDCVGYYYLTKKSVKYKELIRRQQSLRKRKMKMSKFVENSSLSSRSSESSQSKSMMDAFDSKADLQSMQVASSTAANTTATLTSSESSPALNAPVPPTSASAVSLSCTSCGVKIEPGHAIKSDGSDGSLCVQCASARKIESKKPGLDTKPKVEVKSALVEETKPARSSTVVGDIKATSPPSASPAFRICPVASCPNKGARTSLIPLPAIWYNSTDISRRAVANALRFQAAVITETCRSCHGLIAEHLQQQHARSQQQQQQPPPKMVQELIANTIERTLRPGDGDAIQPPVGLNGLGRGTSTPPPTLLNKLQQFNNIHGASPSPALGPTSSTMAGTGQQHAQHPYLHPQMLRPGLQIPSQHDSIEALRRRAASIPSQVGVSPRRMYSPASATAEPIERRSPAAAVFPTGHHASVAAAAAVALTPPPPSQRLLSSAINTPPPVISRAVAAHMPTSKFAAPHLPTSHISSVPSVSASASSFDTLLQQAGLAAVLEQQATAAQHHRIVLDQLAAAQNIYNLSNLSSLVAAASGGANVGVPSAIPSLSQLGLTAQQQATALSPAAGSRTQLPPPSAVSASSEVLDVLKQDYRTARKVAGMSTVPGPTLVGVEKSAPFTVHAPIISVPTPLATASSTSAGLPSSSSSLAAKPRPLVVAECAETKTVTRETTGAPTRTTESTNISSFLENIIVEEIRATTSSDKTTANTEPKASKPSVIPRPVIAANTGPAVTPKGPVGSLFVREPAENPTTTTSRTVGAHLHSLIDQAYKKDAAEDSAQKAKADSSKPLVVVPATTSDVVNVSPVVTTGTSTTLESSVKSGNGTTTVLAKTSASETKIEDTGSTEFVVSDKKSSQEGTEPRKSESSAGDSKKSSTG